MKVSDATLDRAIKAMAMVNRPVRREDLDDHRDTWRRHIDLAAHGALGVLVIDDFDRAIVGYADQGKVSEITPIDVIRWAVETAKRRCADSARVVAHSNNGLTLAAEIARYRHNTRVAGDEATLSNAAITFFADVDTAIHQLVISGLDSSMIDPVIQRMRDARRDELSHPKQLSAPPREPTDAEWGEVAAAWRRGGTDG